MFKVSQVVLMSRQQLRTSDPKMKLQCLIMEEVPLGLSPLLISLSLSPQCIHPDHELQPCQIFRSTSISISVAFSQKPESFSRPRTFCKQTSHSSFKATLAPHPHPQGTIPPPSFFVPPSPHPCSAGLVYIAASPPRTIYPAHRLKDQKSNPEKWATWEQYTSVCSPLKQLQQLAETTQVTQSPCFQKLLKFQRWHQLGVKI